MKLPIDWIPDYWYPQNYMKVWNVGGVAVRDYHFGLAYFNSLKIAFINLTGSRAHQHAGGLCVCQDQIPRLERASSSSIWRR